MNIQGKQLTLTSENIGFNQSLCIICQEDTCEKLLTSEHCRKRICDRAEEIKDNDPVYKRLKQLDENPQFVYHMSNACYKGYTRRLSDKKEICPKVVINVKQKLRSKLTSRFGSTKINIGKSTKDKGLRTTCIICNNITHKGVEKKILLTDEKRAAHFLDAVKFMQDHVYMRVCDLTDSKAVLSAKLITHKNCMRIYLRLYDLKISSVNEQEKIEPKRELFQNLLPNIKETLLKGKGVELSEIRDSMNQVLPDGKKVLNRDVKKLLLNHFPENQIGFTKPKGPKNSQMCYDANICSLDNLTDTLQNADPIKECAEKLRECILKYDFGLKDHFCDANDIKVSWDNIQFPALLLQFFSHLFDFKPDSFEYTKSCYDDAEAFIEEEDIQPSPKGQKKLNSDKCRKIMVLFQIMYYLLHNGKKRTPLHSLMSQTIHEMCKSKNLITSCNRLGLCSSYRETMRVQTDLATYTVQLGKDMVPMPSNIDPSLYTIAAFDNWNHLVGSLSGMDVSNDTVAVLFQNDEGNLPLKPCPSILKINHHDDTFPSILPCQKLQEYHKPAALSTLPDTYSVPDNTIEINEDLFRENTSKDLAYTLSRIQIDTNCVEIKPEKQIVPPWTGVNSVLSEEKLPKSRVGFLPVLPHPVTKYETVYTMMKNFQNIRKQLNQTHIAVACDEGVYQIARNIQLYNPQIFTDIVLFLGSFHMTKILLKCIGRYLDSSGVNEIFTESHVFGEQTQQSVLSGGHYTRSITGMQLLWEALNRLFLKEFFKSKDPSDYQDVFTLIDDFKVLILKKDIPGCKAIFKRFTIANKKLIEDLTEFAARNSEKDETFRFWDVFRNKIMPLLNDTVCSDREGLWDLQLQCLQSIHHLFAAFDATNYLRWASLYLEDMRKLKDDAPEVYKQFIKGRHVVKHTYGTFKAVGADMALEQTINRSRKKSSGILYNTKNIAYCTKWELIHHEMVNYAHLLNNLTGQDQATGELILNHEFTKAATLHSEANVQALVTFIELRGNPFHINLEQTKLRNVITNVLVPEKISEEILNCLELGRRKYEKHRCERFVQKTIAFHETIKRLNMKTFTDIYKESKNSNNSTKYIPEIKEGQLKRKVEVVRERGYNMDDILKYDLCLTSCLFNPKGEMTSADKSDLVRQLEGGLKVQTYPYNSDKVSTCLIDVMNTVRKIKIENISNFGDLCKELTSFVGRSSMHSKRVDYIFDSYVDFSIKDSTRKKRASTSSVIDISVINEDTPLLKDMNKFWGSSGNKERLQTLVYRYIAEIESKKYPDILYVVSHIFNNKQDFPALKCVNGENIELNELALQIEEADARLVPHALHSIKSGSKYLLVISNDADVVMYMFYYWEKFHEAGLEELWIKAGVNNTKRYIPIHILSKKHGSDLCQVLPAIHCLTGCDYTSKFGTKSAALKADPMQYLSDFGKVLSEEDFSKMMIDAENYLVKVLTKNSKETTMDGLRKWQYRHQTNLNIDELPITSASLKPHLLRSYYSCNYMLSILGNMSSFSAENYGFHIEDGLFVPIRIVNLIPDELCCVCGCKKCATMNCKCKKFHQKCTKFCKCEGNDDCRNKQQNI